MISIWRCEGRFSRLSFYSSPYNHLIGEVAALHLIGTFFEFTLNEAHDAGIIERIALKAKDEFSAAFKKAG